MKASKGNPPAQRNFFRNVQAGSVASACAVRLLAALLLLLPAVVQAQFNYTTNDGTITITGYTGPGGAVTIPTNITGRRVTCIGDFAFYYCTSLTSVVIPNSVTNIGNYAFMDCDSLPNVTIPNSVTNIGCCAFANDSGLTSVTIGNHVRNIGFWAFASCTSLARICFRGDVPYSEGQLFLGIYYDPTIYYLLGAQGWTPTFEDLPTVLWNPQVQTGGATFGVRTNRFGFNITGTANLDIVVEACTNLANPAWSPLQTNLSCGGSVYFSDPHWTNYPRRFYHLRWP